MSLIEERYKNVPEYYPTMSMDGFTPNEIMYAARKKMLPQAYEKDLIDEIKIKSEVRLR